MSDRVFLKKNEDRRLRAGHLWAYANEIDTKRSNLSSFTPGQQVTVLASNGGVIGQAYINPHSLIAVRLLSRGTPLFDESVLKQRLQDALQLRETLFSDPFYRWVHAEGDWLPGLVIDRYGSTVVIQSNTAGMDLLLDHVVSLVDELVSPDTIVIRSDSDIRQLEGLESHNAVAKGNVTEHITLRENDCDFEFAWNDSQKTGWFFDQRDNRRAVNAIAKGKTVLDVYCYLGGYGIQALKHGATHATCIDVSEPALNTAQRNAERNQVDGQCTLIQDDGLKGLHKLRSDENQYDIVVIDPPAFVKRRKSLREGLAAYQRLNEAAIGLVKPGGMLVSSSCSYHASRDDFLSCIRRAAIKRDRPAQIVFEGGQGADHPRHPAMPETRYLKTFMCRIL